MRFQEAFDCLACRSANAAALSLVAGHTADRIMTSQADPAPGLIALLRELLAAGWPQEAALAAFASLLSSGRVEEAVQQLGHMAAGDSRAQQGRLASGMAAAILGSEHGSTERLVQASRDAV